MHPNVYLPSEFLQHIESILPKGESLQDFIAACQRPLRKSIRINTLKVSIEQFQSVAEANGWALTPVPWCEEGFWIDADESQVPLGNTAEHMAGWFYIQEASSMLPPVALYHQNSAGYERVLDMAAAPGSKTTQLAALMDNQGLLVANEYSSSRVKVLHANIERCGVRNATLSNYDGQVFGGWLPETFDAVLIDAPCGGEGTVRKDEDALKNWSMASIHAISDTQKQLIESAFHALKPGGELVYSTCTLSHEENQQVCQHLLDTFGDSVTTFTLETLFPGAEKALTEEGYLHVFPQVYDSEGFFIAKFKKLASVTPPKVKKRLGKFPFAPIAAKQASDIEQRLKESLGITLPADTQLWQRDNDIWLFPQTLAPLLTEFKFSRMGIKIAEAHKKGYRWTHQVAMALNAEGGPVVELNREEAREWYMGRDVRPALSGQSGETLVAYQGMILGLGKWVGNRIKNGLPRELVRDKNLF
ncbi:16S rRNA (cytosine(1407)-C(5))-methyltransferase RsmF [Vibrio sp. WXL103]|uniref:16S rRNA (cytosine(1407)-C(5))-methyltransferase RsmF n=1 Tax=Vibrio sp. WXL103 TaxID=3450710 RepID=UPI003EC640AC